MTIFQKEVWESLKKIPRGKIATYGEIARFLGKPKACRAVGTAVGKNPNAPRVPCHRVVNSDGRVGNYSGKGGVSGKISILKKEGVNIKDGKIDGFEKKLFKF